MNKLLSCMLIVAAIGNSVRCGTVDKPTPVTQCDGENIEGLEQRIKVVPCGSKRCKLTKLTNTTVSFLFKPKEKVKELTNDVYAVIGEIRLPFIGVWGESACGHVRRADTGERAQCPLQSGLEYIYENEFPILPVYPVLDRFKVYWSLNDGKRKVICFEVPATIVPAKAPNN